MKITDKFKTKDGFEVSFSSLRSTRPELQNKVVFSAFRRQFRDWGLRFDRMTMSDIDRQVQCAVVATLYLI